MQEDTSNKNLSGVKIFVFLFVFIGLLFLETSCRKKAEEPSVQPEKSERAGLTDKKREDTSPLIPAKKAQAEKLTFQTVPKDGESVWKLDEPLVIFFSQAVSAEDLVFKVSPDPGGWTTSWQDEGKQAVLQHAQSFLQGKVYEWEIVLKSFNKKQTVRFTAYGPTSFELIDEDEKKGILDMNTAWPLRFQALFEPGLLPKDYQSPTPVISGTPMLVRFSRIRSQLKKETLDKLKPYLVRPMHPESIFSRRLLEDKEEFPSKDTELSGKLYAQRPILSAILNLWMPPVDCPPKIRIWARNDAAGKAKAQEVCQALKDYQMFEKFIDVMEAEPLPDAGGKTAEGMNEKNKRERFIIDTGGNDSLDIYIVKPHHLKDTDPDSGKVVYACGMCCDVYDTRITPAHILIRQDLSGDQLKSTLAHELFHAFQFAFDSDESLWWMEGTAVWATDFIGPHWNKEHVYVPHAFESGTHTLKTITSEDGRHEYGIYIFPYYLGMPKKFGFRIVGQIWRGCKEETKALEAVENVLREDFREVFQDFALLNYDDTSNAIQEEYPETLNVINSHGAREEKISKAGRHTIEKIEVPPLGATYIRIYNRIPQEQKKQLPHMLFDLEPLAMMEELTVTALFDPEFGEEPEDWTGMEEKSLCLNFDDDDFNYLILVIANHARDFPVFSTFDIEVNADRCLEGDAVGKVTYRQITKSYSDYHKDNVLTWSKDENNIEGTVYAAFSYKESQYAESTEEITEVYEVKSWEIVSIQGIFTDYRFNESQTPGYPNYQKNIYDYRAHGAMPLDMESSDVIGNLEIVFDAQTGKAKAVRFPNFVAPHRWKGSWEETHVSRSGTRKDGGAIDQKGIILRLSNWVGDSSSIVQGGYLAGCRVRKGESGSEFSGEAKHVTINSREPIDSGTKTNYQQLQTSWTLKRNIKKKKQADK
ncbi:MAG: hypothetical protein JXB26_08135 [Candidatus Aminicenantes bacterium]|nr:hypothetical protein [Candidatus Aminicenantes bacterium]